MTDETIASMVDSIDELKEEIETLSEAIESIKTAASFWRGDWLENHRLAWIHLILFGFDEIITEDYIKEEFKWSQENIDRIKRYNKVIK